MNNLLGKWKWYEVLFLGVGEAAIIVSFIFAADKNWLSLITSLIGVFIVMGTAKGLVIAPFVNIVFNILYSIVSISQKYYGEAIIYIFMMMPIAVFTIIQWIRNKNPEKKEEVLVGGIKKIEYPILAGATVVLTFAFYFLLKVLNTNELVVSTISLVTSVVASYLLIRRLHLIMEYIIRMVHLMTMCLYRCKITLVLYLSSIKMILQTIDTNIQTLIISRIIL